MIQLMTIDQVAEQLQVPVATLYKWRASQYGPKALKVGKYLRWQQVDVDAWITAQVPASNVTPISARRTA